MDGEAVWLTIRLASATTALLMLLAVPLAWWLSTRHTVARSLVQTLVALPLVLPPSVLGFYLLVLLGPLTAPGRAITRAIGHPLAFSFGGLLLGSMLYSLPFAVQPMLAGLESLHREYAEAAAGLGASPWKAFSTVTLPLAKDSLLTSAVLTFTHTVGEFGVVLMLGGNIPGSTRTLSISLYDLVEEGRYAEANRTAALLIAAAVLALLLIYLRRLTPRRREVMVGG